VPRAVDYHPEAWKVLSEKQKFVQDQMGHDHASTTSLYTCVSSDYRVSTLRRVLDTTIKDALSLGQES